MFYADPEGRLGVSRGDSFPGGTLRWGKRTACWKSYKGERRGVRGAGRDKAGRAGRARARGGPDLDFLLSAMGISAAPGHGLILPNRALGP